MLIGSPALAYGTAHPGGTIGADGCEPASSGSTGKKAGFYLERRSYGTLRDTEPPRYVKQANRTWLKYYGFANADWLDIGLDYRLRYQYRDNDFRRTRQSRDEPILLRTRGFIGIKESSTPCA